MGSVESSQIVNNLGDKNEGDSTSTPSPAGRGAVWEKENVYADGRAKSSRKDLPLGIASLFGCSTCCNGSRTAQLRENSASVDVPPWKELGGAQSVMHFPVSEFPLHQAADRGDYVTVERLILWAGVDVNGSDQHRRTPLHHAAFGGHMECVKLLLLHNADTSMTTCDGYTPCQVALQADMPLIAELILRAELKTSPNMPPREA